MQAPKAIATRRSLAACDSFLIVVLRRQSGQFAGPVYSEFRVGTRLERYLEASKRDPLCNQEVAYVPGSSYFDATRRLRMTQGG